MSLQTVVATTLEEIRTSCPQGYVKTPALHAVLGCLKEKGVCLVLGLPGHGKTTLALQAMKQLMETEGLRPVRLTSPEEWERLFQEDKNYSSARPKSVSREDSYDSQKAPPSREMSTDSQKAPPSREMSTDSQKAPPSREISTDSQKAPPSREMSTDSQKAPSSREMSTDSQKAPSSREISTDSQKATPSREMSTDSQKVTPSREISTDSQKATPSSEISTDSQKATPSREISTDSQKVTPSREMSTDSQKAPPSREVSTDNQKIPPIREMTSDKQKVVSCPRLPYVVLLEDALVPGRGHGWEGSLSHLLTRAGARGVPVILTSTNRAHQACCNEKQLGHLLSDLKVVQLQNSAMWGEEVEEQILSNLLHFQDIHSCGCASAMVRASTLSSVGFPLSAAIFSRLPDARSLGEQFFKDPVGFLIFHFESMKKEDAVAYYVLVLTWLRSGHLSLEGPQGLNEVPANCLSQIQALCGLSNAPTVEETRQAAESLKGTYLLPELGGASYRFSHAALRDCLVLAACQSDLKGVLDVCSMEQVTEHIATEGGGDGGSGLAVAACSVPRSQWKLLAGRLAQEMVAGSLDAALEHPSLRNGSFLQDFLDHGLSPSDRKKLLARKWKTRCCSDGHACKSGRHVSSLTFVILHELPDLARHLLASEEMTSLPDSERAWLMEDALSGACRVGDCGLVSLLVDRGARVTGDTIRALGRHGVQSDVTLAAVLAKATRDLDRRDSRGQTLLHVAAAARLPHVLEGLLDRGARGDVEDRSGSLALHLLCFASDWEPEGEEREALHRVGGLLVQRTPDVNHKTRARETPLLLAAQSGNVFMVEALLGHGASANIKDNTKNLPLHWFCAQVTRLLPSEEAQRVGELILKSTGDINHRNIKGETALHVAARLGKVHLVGCLLSHGARADVEDDTRALALHKFCPRISRSLSREDIRRVGAQLLAKTPDLNHQTQEGRTPLHQAARFGSLVMVELLLKAKARADVLDNQGALPLNLFAPRPSREVGKGEVRRVGSLLVRAVHSLDLHDTQGQTPLHLTARAGNLLMTELLLRARAPVDVKDHGGCLPLHVCGAEAPPGTSRRDLERLGILLLERTSDVNQRNTLGETPLAHVAKSGHVVLVELLLRVKARAEGRDQAGNLPLHWFCLHSCSREADRDDVRRVGALLAGLSPNLDVRNSEGETPLHLAARAGNSAMVETLLDCKARPGIKDNRGFLPLHEFCGESTAGLPREEIERAGTMLVKRTPNLNHAPWPGCTPLYSATLCGNLAMLEILLNHGARADLKDAAEFLPLHYFSGLSVEDHPREDVVRVGALLVMRTPHLNQRDGKGETALLRAALHDNVFMVEVLLKAGAMTYADDDEGRVPLHVYGPQPSPWLPQEDIERVGALLVEKTPDVQHGDKMGTTALHAAAASGSVYLVARLLERGAHADIPDVAGNLPLHLYSPLPSRTLSGQEIERVGRLLVERTPDLEQTNKEGLTPLHLAAWAGSLHVVELLLNRGARADVEDKAWNLPLHWFCGRHQRRLPRVDVERVGSLLVGKTPNIAHKNKKGQTPFHVAVSAENVHMVEILMKHMREKDFAKILPLHWFCQEPLHHFSREEVQRLGTLLVQSSPDINQRNRKGETALHLAARSRNLYMLTTLLAHGANANLEDRSGWLPLHRLSYLAPIFLSLEGSTLAHLQDLVGEDLLGEELVQEDLVEEMLVDAEEREEDADEGVPSQVDLEQAGLQLLQKTSDLNKRTRSGKTALHLAIKSNLQVMVEALVRQGARGDVANKSCRLPLHLLCTACDIGDVLGEDLSSEFLHMGTLLLRCTPDVNQVDKRKQTPLHLAGASRNFTLVEMLLTHGADTGMEDRSGSLPLHLFCQHVFHSRPTEVRQRVGELFISRTSNLNHRNRKGETPLHLAAKSGSIILVDILLKHQARADLTDHAKNLPLHWFSSRSEDCSSRDLGVQRVGRLLVQSTPNVSAKNEAGDTPLHLAGKSGNSFLVEILLQRGVKTAARDKAGLLPIHCYAANGEADRRVGSLLARVSPDINARIRHGETALHLAATSGSCGILEALLRQGARADLQDNAGTLPLHRLAARGPDVHLDPRSAALLLRKTPDVNQKSLAGDTALHVAARRLTSAMVKILLEHGARADLEDGSGSLALHWFCAVPEQPVLEEETKDVAGALLVQKTPDLNHSNKEGETPLLLATKAGRLRMVEILLKHGARTDLPDKSGALPLHWGCAAGSSDVEVRKTLERLGALLVAATGDLDHRTKSGETALHLAVSSGCLPLVEALLRRGARADLEDSCQALPLHRYCALEDWRQLSLPEVKSVGSLLVEKTPSVNRQTKDGNTALHLALKTDNFIMARILLKNKAKVDAANSAGTLPLHLCASKLNKLAGEKEKRRVENQLIAMTTDLNHQNHQGLTPLHLAAKSGSLRIVQSLLERQALAGLSDAVGNMPLHWLCLWRKTRARSSKTQEDDGEEDDEEDEEEGDDDDENEDIEDDDAEDDEELEDVREEEVEETKKDGEKLDSPEGDDEDSSETETETMYEESEEDESQTEHEDESADDYDTEAEDTEDEQDELQQQQQREEEKLGYHVCSELRHLVKSLVQETPDLSHRDARGRTALHAAARGGNLVLLDALLKAGCRTDVEDNGGNLPLHALCSAPSRRASPRERERVGSLLTQKTPDVRQKNLAGETPYSVAVSQQDHVMMDVLEGVTADARASHEQK